MLVRRYSPEQDESLLLAIIRSDEEWDYADDDKVENYKNALINSITYVAYKGKELCGFCRSIDDAGLYFIICDLLVDPKFRGHEIGIQTQEPFADKASCIHVEIPPRDRGP